MIEEYDQTVLERSLIEKIKIDVDTLYFESATRPAYARLQKATIYKIYPLYTRERTA